MTQPVDDTILKKIAKLLKLAKSDNQHEAALAAARAAELMARNDIEEATVRARLEDDGQTVVEPIDTEVSGYRNKTAESWAGQLAMKMCEALGLHCHWHHTFGDADGKPVHDKNGQPVEFKTIKFIGRTNNARTAGYMFLVLTQEIERLCKEAYSKLDPLQKPIAAAATAWFNAFKLAAALEVGNRMIAHKKQVMSDLARDPEKSKALIVLKKQDLELSAYYDKYRKIHGIVGRGRTHHKGDSGAAAAGRAAGASINIAGAKTAIGAGARRLKG